MSSGKWVRSFDGKQLMLCTDIAIKEYDELYRLLGHGASLMDIMVIHEGSEAECKSMLQDLANAFNAFGVVQDENSTQG